MISTSSTSAFSAKYINPTENQIQAATKIQSAIRGKLNRLNCSSPNATSGIGTTLTQRMQQTSNGDVSLQNLFLTNLPLARKIINYALYQGVLADRNTALTSLSNSDLLQIAHQFYQENQPTEGQDDTKINDYLQGMLSLINRMEAKKGSNESARAKLEWFLENACSTLDTSFYAPSDLLVSDGRLVRSPHDEAMLCTKAKIALSYALQQLPSADWSAQTNWRPQAPAHSQVACLEKVISLQTILQNTEGLFNDHIPNLLAASNELHTPTREEQNVQAAQHNDQLQNFNFMQQMQQVLAARNEGGQQQLELMAQIPQQQPVRIEAYQAKMRCLISAAAALIKFGNAQQKNQSLDLIDQVKTLFDSSKNHVYNFDQEDSTRTGVLLRQANEQERANKHDTILNKALCVQIMAGQSQQAMHYIQSTFDSTTRQTEMLLNLIKVTQQNKLLSSPSSQAALFKQPLSQLTDAIFQDQSMRSGAQALQYIAEAFHKMNLPNEASATLDKSIDSFTARAQQLNMDQLELDDILSFESIVEDMESLIKTMANLGQIDKIKPMIDRQPTALKPYLLACTCEILFNNHNSKKRKIDEPSPLSSTINSYWAQAKSIAMQLSTFRKVDALLHLTNSRYTPLQESGEADAIIQDVRAMNDGSPAFTAAFQPYEYRIGPA